MGERKDRRGRTHTPFAILQILGVREERKTAEALQLLPFPEFLLFCRELQSPSECRFRCSNALLDDLEHTFLF